MQTFKTNVINIHGEIGKAWLLDLPKIINNLDPVEELINS